MEEDRDHCDHGTPGTDHEPLTVSDDDDDLVQVDTGDWRTQTVWRKIFSAPEIALKAGKDNDI